MTQKKTQPKPTKETVASLFTTDRSKVKPMTEELTKTFLMMTMTEMGELSKSPDGYQALGGEELIKKLEGTVGTVPFIPMVMIKRIQVCAPDVKMHDLTVWWLSCLCDTPAMAVMYAYSLVHATRTLGKPVTLADWAELSPWGIITEEYAHSIWDSQKYAEAGMGNNWLDTMEAYQ